MAAYPVPCPPCREGERRSVVSGEQPARSTPSRALAPGRRFRRPPVRRDIARPKDEDPPLPIHARRIAGGATPRLAISQQEVLHFPLDSRAGFLLAQVDGRLSFEDLFAISPLSRSETIRILASLLEAGVIR